ncbi:MAG: Gfo/Idh/MocA family oxidoreductase [Terrimicrobiaceae bacterium]|nr:Gfo/Idh/MocA family oxidoreductase [Terrimicrobiaceae bacterium]
MSAPTPNKIPIAIVGLNFGRWIVADRDKPEGLGKYFELVSVCDLDPARAHDIATKAGVPACTNLDEILTNPKIPVVGIFTSPSGRSDLIRKAIRAGKDVMTTKPFETDAEKAGALLEEARALGRVVHLNSPGPLVPPDLQRIEEWREQYQLGRPIGGRAEVYASYREKANGSWYDDPDKCAVAPIFRLGIYVINDLVRLFGEAESAQVLKSRIFTERPTPDNAQLGILFKSGAVASVFASFCIDDGQPYASSTTLHFENGTIYRNVGRLAFGGGPKAPTKVHVVARRNGEPVIESAEYANGSGEYQWEAFYRAIHGEKLETPREVVIGGLRIIAAMARAEKSGATEPVR